MCTIVVRLVCVYAWCAITKGAKLDKTPPFLFLIVSDLKYTHITIINASHLNKAGTFPETDSTIYPIKEHPPNKNHS